MNKLLCQHIENLKSVLLSLPPTDEKGFEGLIGAALHEISGVPFRLAGSGSQFGIDGKSAYPGDAICFEGKRYGSKIPRNEVLSKIAALCISGSDTDIWILGATSQITSQLADDICKLGAKTGIVVLILDWSEMNLPPFAVALAMAGRRVQDFLKSNISEDEKLQKTEAAFQAIRNSQEYSSHADRIRAQCSVPTMGLALAQSANTEWLCDAFCNKQQARMEFGQPLSPGDTNTTNIRPRKVLTEGLQPYLSATSDEKIVFILGDEGHGKSWLVAQSWLAMTQKPIMIVMTPDDFDKAAYQNDMVDLLISKLIRQTGDSSTDSAQKRWSRMLLQCRECQATDRPPLIVVIDGINQRPYNDWARIIEKLSDKLNMIGGCLLVTSRTSYFRDYVKRRLSIHYDEISVPEWTESERNEILAGDGIEASSLQHAVATSLRNPRLLGIALELMSKEDIANFEELSVSRLLFEHMRTSERDAPEPQPVQDFVQRLRRHAQEILSRVEENCLDDLSVFEGDVVAVADGRFFKAVDGDSKRYTLQDDGLTLALGFSVIDQLRSAKRNDRNLDDKLTSVFEPIAALDDTANVMLAALTVAATDECFDQEIIASLVKGFAAIQNPDQNKFLAFANLANKQPQSFMDAVYALCLCGGYQPNFDWIQNALVLAGRNSRTWKPMIERVKCWLSVYSLSPEQGGFRHRPRDPHGEVQEEREKNRKKIEEKLNALSADERAILEQLGEVPKDFSRLSRLALFLLAGKSLTPFAKSFLNWTFSHALNSSHTAPYKDFIDLVSLNRVDWSQTRTALLEESAPLRGTDASRTGKWALVNALRATGHSDDDQEAERLLANLTKDMPSFKGGRLVEKYCETDPCDPGSNVPENIVSTAEKYAEIDVSTLRQNRGQTSEDHFFREARPGTARFKPKFAIAKQREFAADVFKRESFPLLQGLLDLRQHNALLTIKEAHELIRKRDKVKAADTSDSMSEHDKWIVSQYYLLLAFPFLSAQEQVDVLLANETEEDILLDLMDLAKPLREKEFDRLLGRVCAEKDEYRQHLLLTFAHYTSVQLSTDARNHIALLLLSESDRVRVQAFGVMIQSGDKQLLGQFAGSDWKATNAKNENEAWYGSMALLEAAVTKLIPHTQVLNRISEDLYGHAAIKLNDVNIMHNIASRIDVAINQAVGLDSNLVAPDIELRAYSSIPSVRSRFSISERPSEVTDIKEAMMQFAESDAVFEQRQRRNLDAFLEFKASLTQAKVRIILNDIRLNEFAAVVEASSDYADNWYELFMNIAEPKLPTVHNLILLLAYALGKKYPNKAKELFRRVQDSKPLVRCTYEKAGVPLGAMATWAGSRNPILDNLRYTRLDHAGDDHALALEVLAALLSGKQELLNEYVKAKLCKEEPSEISRGIMVVGFSDQSEFNDGILKKYETSGGLIGNSQKAAKYAYERNVWARYWFDKMCRTNENTDFWRFSVLFLKIVDGRYDIWRSDCEQKGSPIQSFGFTVDAWIHNRYTRWENLRSKKLFGLDAPTPIFLNVS